MKVLELFSGTECMSDAFRRRGHECFTVDYDEQFPSSLHIDILQLTADMVNIHSLRLIRDLAPRFFFIENPMGGLRKMDYMQGIPRHLITYCQYGFPYRKATDIFTNHPHPGFLPPCRNGDPCHQPAPRGTKQGLQGVQGARDRSKYPPQLCEHIVDICEGYMGSEGVPVSFGRKVVCPSLFE